VTRRHVGDEVIAVLDGGAYGLSPYLRLSFAAAPDAVEAGSKAIAAACGALVVQKEVAHG